MNFIYAVSIFYVFLTSSLYAYLDPGSSSIILQAILGAIAAAGATIGIYWRKFKDFFAKIFKKKKK